MKSHITTQIEAIQTQLRYEEQSNIREELGKELSRLVNKQLHLCDNSPKAQLLSHKH